MLTLDSLPHLRKAGAIKVDTEGTGGRAGLASALVRVGWCQAVKTPSSRAPCMAATRRAPGAPRRPGGGSGRHDPFAPPLPLFPPCPRRAPRVLRRPGADQAGAAGDPVRAGQAPLPQGAGRGKSSAALCGQSLPAAPAPQLMHRAWRRDPRAQVQACCRPCRPGSQGWPCMLAGMAQSRCAALFPATLSLFMWVPDEALAD